MKCLQKLAKIKDDKNFFVVMVSTFLFGLIAHGYCYFNLFYSFDALVSISQYSNIVWQISLGRFLCTQSCRFFIIIIYWIICLFCFKITGY